MSSFDRFCTLLQDHRVFVGVVCGLLLIYYVPVFIRALVGGRAPSRIPVRRAPSKGLPPVSATPQTTPRPAPPLSGGGGSGGQEDLGSALDQAFGGIDDGIPAKNLQLPSSPSKSTHGEAAQLEARIERDKSAFPGEAPGDAGAATATGDPPLAETPTRSIRRKASRMEELGFHVGIHSDAVPGAAGATASASDKPLPGVPAARTETAELTSILERIDKFLAEDQPGAGPGTPGITAHAPAAPPPASAPVSVNEAAASPAGHAATAEPSATKPLAAPPSEASAKEASAQDAPKDTAPKDTAPKDAGSKDTAPKDTAKDIQKSKPLWARPDAQDEDAEPTSGDKGTGPAKPGDGAQQRLF